MVKVDEGWLRRAEDRYPGFRTRLDYYESLELPTCPQCGSADSAVVSTGLVGRSIHLAGATSKIKLVPNGHPGDFYCWTCGHFFNGQVPKP